jgi:hypothetical protein
MKHFQRAIALSGLFLLLTVLALAQERRAIVDIPFKFTVGEKTLRAGEYLIEQNRRDSDTVWVIRNTAHNDTAVIMTNAVRANTPPEETQLVFNRYDELYFLSQIWIPGTNTGREIRISGIERVLEKAQAERRQEHILTASRR